MEVSPRETQMEGIQFCSSAAAAPIPAMCAFFLCFIALLN